MLLADAAGAQQAPEPTGACAEGTRAFLAGSYDKARQLLIDCLPEVGERVDALLYLTIIDVLDEAPTPALDWGARAVLADSLSADVRYWYGRAQLVAGRRDEAHQQWNRGLLLAPGHVGLLEGLARFALEEGEDAQAYGLLSQLMRQGVDDAWVHDLLADLARRKGHWEQARQHLRDAVLKGGGSELRWLGIGELSLLCADAEGAVQAFTQLAQRFPSASATGGLGEALFAAGRTEEAVAELEKAVELDGAEGRYRFNLANVLEILGRTEAAEEHFRRYLELEPDDPMGRLNFGVHLRKRGRLVDALHEIETAVARDPNLLPAQVTRAELLLALDRPESALEVIESLIAQMETPGGEMLAWRDEVERRVESDDASLHAGEYRLRHIITSDADVATVIAGELAEGGAFADLAVRYSSGPTAAGGGDIGWIDPQGLRGALREAVLQLDIGGHSGMILVGDERHFFQRVR